VVSKLGSTKGTTEAAGPFAQKAATAVQSIVDSDKGYNWSLNFDFSFIHLKGKFVSKLGSTKQCAEVEFEL